MTSPSGAQIRTIIPNDVVRRVRRHYLVLLVAAISIGFGAFLLAGNNIAPPLLTLMLLIGAGGLLVFAVLVLRSGVCPRCNTTLMWQEKTSLTASRISLFTKSKCPNCGLDLDQPFAVMDERRD